MAISDETADFAGRILEQFKLLTADMDGFADGLRALDARLEGIQERQDALFREIDCAAYPLEGAVLREVA